MSKDYKKYYDFSPNLDEPTSESEDDDFAIPKTCYVQFKTLGLQQLLEYYKRGKDYDLDIEIIESKGPFLTQEARKELEIRKIFSRLANNQIAGLVFMTIGDEENLIHAIPFLVAKKNDRLRLIKFEKDQHIFVKDGEVETAMVANYRVDMKYVLQHDIVSCATFSFNTLKNCLLDDDFLKSCLDDTKPTLKVKERMGQSRLYETSFKAAYRASVDEKEHTQFQDDYGAINLKAWFKGHDYARKINPSHLDLLDDYNRKLFLRIDERRREIKANAGMPEAETGDDLFRGAEIDLPDNSPKKPKSTKEEVISTSIK